MIITTLSNKSVCITSDMPHEAEIVASFRQFAIGDKVRCFDRERTVLDVETVVQGDTIQNVYTLSSVDMKTSLQVAEYHLLAESPRPCPANIMDAIADVLLATPPFTSPFTVDISKADEMRSLL